MKCKRCKRDFVESQIEEHHLYPKFMDNPKGLGLKYGLCKNCHDFLHKIMLKWIWFFVPANKKNDCIEYVKSKSKRWIEQNENTKTTAEC